jgi:stalled ribosome alternative rescue factor ArfA
MIERKPGEKNTDVKRNEEENIVTGTMIRERIEQKRDGES